MKMPFNPVDIQEALDLLFLFSTFMEKHTRIKTPFHFPDGTVIDVYHTEETHQLSDLGTTVQYLSSLEMTPSPSMNVESIRTDINICYGVRYERGVFFIPVTAEEESIAWGIVKLVEALLFYVAVRTSGSYTHEENE